MQELKTDTEVYGELTARQINQYKDTDIMHDLPAIFEYWSAKNLTGKAESVIGHSDILEFYADYLGRGLRESNSSFLVSIGAGDCSIEISIVKLLLSHGYRNFFFVCLELSPFFVAKARQRIDEEGLGDIITVSQTDINNWQAKYQFAGVMAHHALHHMLSLESLFDLIKNNLAKNGRFVTCDVIGRNGHMRWPEALILTRKLWKRLPRKYKYHHQFKRLDEYFDNWDCSTEGFEGIRAEDILPLLVKTFSFEVFFAYGNLTDPFVDRGFGPNFDPNNSSDTALIDCLQGINENLIDSGILKPTHLVAVMTNEKRTPAIYKHWTPEFSIRVPGSAAPVYDLEPLLQKIPSNLLDEPNDQVNSENYQLNTVLKFNNQVDSNGAGCLTYGWCTPEEEFTWSSCEDAGLIFSMDKEIIGDAELRLRFIPYISSLHKEATIHIGVNDKHLKTMTYAAPAELHELVVEIPADVIASQKVVSVSLMFPNRRQPQFEAGDDIRSVGIALVSASLSGAVQA